MSEDTEVPRTFAPTLRNRDDSPGAGPAWHQKVVRESMDRIRTAPTVAQAHAQAAVEQLVVLHSIRRILIWTAVIIPALVAAVGIILMVAGSADSSCSVYSTRC